MQEVLVEFGLAGCSIVVPFAEFVNDSPCFAANGLRICVKCVASVSGGIPTPAANKTTGDDTLNGHQSVDGRIVVVRGPRGDGGRRNTSVVSLPMTASSTRRPGLAKRERS
jgi:hypothetical protein